MEKNAHALSQRDNYAPFGFTRFLWWLSTAEKELIKDCTVDRNRYAITGMTVLCTWLFATLAWSYFFSTVMNDKIVSILPGIFMGFVILSIDRALIKGITVRNKHKLTPILFRLVLALTIGTFMAQPALLYLFDKEIHVQISLDNEIRKMAKQQELDSLYKQSMEDVQQTKYNLQLQLQSKYNEVAASRAAYIAETDGTGGSGRVGLKDIAKAKQTEYQKLNDDYNSLLETTAPGIKTADSILNAIQQEKQKEMITFNSLMNDGFLTRIEALQNLILNNSAAKFSYYLLIIILVLIELMPVIAKSLLPEGTYDEKVRLREEMERHVTALNIEQEGKLKELYNQVAYEQDRDFIRSFFDEAKNERRKKMMVKFKQWNESGEESFDKLWENIKQDVLTKQES
ncbi:MAG: DUF4407 domain-containing protein [Bacteroidetes bacterium]|nr:DUF4407 domain-containing protein [Bacteroidota bacterium]